MKKNKNIPGMFFWLQRIIFVGTVSVLPLAMDARSLDPIEMTKIYGQLGDAPDLNLGYRLWTIPDFNDDGVSDVAVGLPYKKLSDTQQGQVQIISGKDGQLIFNLNGTDIHEFGYAFAAPGDVTGDGYQDFIVGSPASAGGTDITGEVILLRSKETENGLAYDYQRIHGKASGDFLGRSVIWLGTRENTFLATSPKFTGGTAYIIDFNNPNLDTEIKNSDLDFQGENERKGYLAWESPDINGDGQGEFILGAIGQAPGNAPISYVGRLYFYDRQSGALTCVLEGDEPTTHLGRRFSILSDLNDDGFPEVFVGAPHQKINGKSNAGKAYVVNIQNLCKDKVKVVKMSDLGERVLYVREGQTATALMGFQGVALNDFTGDGVREFALSANGYPDGRLGTVFVMDGKTGEELLSISGDPNAMLHFFGGSLAFVPEQNVLVVGSPYYTPDQKVSKRYIGSLDGFQLNDSKSK